MSDAPHREVFRSKDGKTSIWTNQPDFKWPTRDEKIDALLATGLIDQAEADRLRAKFPTNTARDLGER